MFAGTKGTCGVLIRKITALGKLGQPVLKNSTLILVQSGLHALSYSICCLCLLVGCYSFLEGQKGKNKIVPPIFVLHSNKKDRVVC